MYRDDDEAARALADKLRRENQALEDERAELSNEKAELADDNAALLRENARLKARLAVEDERGVVSTSDPRAISDRPNDPEDPGAGTSRRRRRGRRGAREQATSESSAALFVRLVAMIIAGGVGALVTWSLYPVFHDKTGMFPTILSAVLNQLWGQLLLAQALLGWMPDERKRTRLSPRWRIGTLVMSLVAIAVTAAFIARVGESSMGT